MVNDFRNDSSAAGSITAKGGSPLPQYMDTELQKLLDCSCDGIFVTDGQGNTLWVNSAICRFDGASLESYLGKNVKELESEKVFLPSASLQVIETKRKATLIQTTKMGRKVIVTANPIFDENGELVRVISNVRDITELVDLKPDIEEKREVWEYQRELEELSHEVDLYEGIIAHSFEMEKVLNLASKVAASEANVLILGESGVGKDVVASLIHSKSRMKEGPFIKVNCGAIPENLMESEFFGYERGAFTGAKKEGKPGFFEMADGGTIFLNEIGEVPLSLQTKFLSVIQERQLIRVGGLKPKKLDFRVVAATNKNLFEQVKQGLFREDLYYRLNVIQIKIPPLRERKDDILSLLNYYLQKFSQKYGVKRRFSSEIIEELINYSWPGNVRELENMVERLVITSESPTIDVSLLPQEVIEYVNENAVHGMDQRKGSLKEMLSAYERQIISEAYKELKSSYKVAKALGISQTQAARKIREYGLDKK